MFFKAKIWYNDCVVTPIPKTERGNWLEVQIGRASCWERVFRAVLI